VLPPIAHVEYFCILQVEYLPDLRAPRAFRSFSGGQKQNILDLGWMPLNLRALPARLGILYGQVAARARRYCMQGDGLPLPARERWRNGS